MKSNRRGFTLIELLVSVALASLLVTVLAVLFFRTTSTVVAGEARMAVSEDGRHALDQVASDLENMHPSTSAAQRFHASDGPGDATLPDGSEAKDALAMVTSTMVPDGAGGRVLATVLSEYFLAAETDPELSIAGGTANAIRSGRPLKALKRRTWRITKDAALGVVKGALPLNLSAATAAGLELIEENTLHQFVMSMNVELFENPAWRELHATGSALIAALPIGDVAGEPVLPRKVRISLRVIEGSGENCERLFQRECWVPAE
ncbi:MAG: prepilin-type N-terminal cleavage/methylation domain-containing protein [Planctomycetota bacterium]